MKTKHLSSYCIAGLCAGFMSQPATAAPDAGEEWDYLLRIYAWLPSIDGNLNYSLPGGGDSISVDASDILDNLKMTFVGSFIARKGDWSLFTDLLYLNVGNSGTTTVGPQLGPGVEVRVKQNLKGWVWNLGGGYTVYRTDRANLDLLLGARMFAVDTDVEFRPDGPLPPSLPERELSEKKTLWHGIAGVKGKFDFNDRWFAPYYLDVGTGDSKLTWQAAAGVGYGFDWGDVTLSYRHLSFDQKSGKLIDDLSFSGPALGVNFRF